MKWVLWSLGGILLLVIIVLAIGLFYFQKEIKKEDPSYLVNFLKENRDRKGLSLSIHYNNQPWVAVHPDEKLPLASTVKIIVAIEYARQAAAGKVDPNQPVQVGELETYYIPKSDGGAHEAWLESLGKDAAPKEVPLIEVAKGMIAYSSNANTDYLIRILGMDAINQLLDELKLTQHERIYPIVAALYIPTYVAQKNTLSKEETIKALQEMELVQYQALAEEIHQQWEDTPLTDDEKKQVLADLTKELDRNWSDRLPRSTTAEYIGIMNRLNTKSDFQPDVYTYLDPVMEQLMQNPTNQKWLSHAGQKGGSTRFILTNAMYATDLSGNKTEFAFFANDLTSMEQAKLSRNLNGFQLKFLKDEDFREQVKRELAREE
jgi:D-alanyl-D-alanine carboxypeptidase